MRMLCVSCEFDVHGAVDRNACGNAAAVERLYLDRAAIVDGCSAQSTKTGAAVFFGTMLMRSALADAR